MSITKVALLYLILIISTSSASIANAQSGKFQNYPIKSLNQLQDSQTTEEYLSELSLDSGTRVTIIAPNYWTDIAEEFKTKLREYHVEFQDLFGNIPPFHSTVRIMEENDFFLKTRAPRWTNALFFKNEIMIPLGNEYDFESIHKALKHEFSHAAINSLTKGRCPGWMDEGLAQWIEGQENPALAKALERWLDTHQPIRLTLLQGGFTKLKTEMVPAAYAQSLFTINSMISSFGFEGIQEYFKMLRLNYNDMHAFEKSFNISKVDYERYLRALLEKWHKNR
jgi:hypothetical protein